MWPVTEEKVIICPNCGSEFIIEGVISPEAAKYQSVYCPVCGQKITVNTVKFLGLGRIWYTKPSGAVLKRNPNPPPPSPEIVSTPTIRPIKPVITRVEAKKEKLPDWLKIALIAGGIVLGGLLLEKILE